MGLLASLNRCEFSQCHPGVLKTTHWECSEYRMFVPTKPDYPLSRGPAATPSLSRSGFAERVQRG